ncbi:hypothetical protein PGTUg99_011956 [Puccinia graminis f. sp. tritici]|uniref:Uncharacterized protein n=1 Tax=Puccinia graminis f. sp. tritici TaxID=56615 RepID=A0A5B0LI42_PUCGR|nr:hypothetical protein PGTUg99_011956 [Puccinia graminis f. sp. tritici]
MEEKRRSSWARSQQSRPGPIRANLDTATITFLGLDLDFVQLKSEEYGNQDSCIPSSVDAFRRCIAMRHYDYFQICNSLRLITLPAILLICSIRKQHKFINRLEDLMHRDYMSLGIQILDELAPSAHTATVYLKTLKILVDLLEVENLSVLESLASPPSDKTNNSPLPPHPSSAAQVHPLPQTLPVNHGLSTYNENIHPQIAEDPGPSESSWDPLEISALAFDDPELGHLSSSFIPPNPPRFSSHNHP